MIHFMRDQLYSYREPHRAVFILITSKKMNKARAVKVRGMDKAMAVKVRGMDKAMAARVRDMDKARATRVRGMDINRAMDMGTNRMISAHG